MWIFNVKIQHFFIIQIVYKGKNMKGKLITSSRIQYEEGGFRKYINILPETDTSEFNFGDEVEFDIVQKLNEGVTYTDKDGWNKNPIEGEYAKLKNLWEEIEEEYMKDEYPVFGGPFTNSLTPWEWLRKHYKVPLRK